MDPVSETPTEPVDYAALNAVWSAALAGVLVTTRGEAPRSAELPVLGLAAFAATKALSKEKVGAWARAPVVEEDGSRRPKGRRLRYAVGELMTCTRCLGTWTALGLVGLQVARPREGRIVTTILATAAINDWLQAGFGLATSKSNAVAKLAETPLERWPEVSGRV
jgi:hypothetical protein